LVRTRVGLALALRRRPDWHGRLMLLASIGFVGPPFTRIASWFGELPNPLVSVIFLFPLALVVHDLVSRRRVHAATALGIVIVLAPMVILRFLGIGKTFIALQAG
jgi:hypothetical protein